MRKLAYIAAFFTLVGCGRTTTPYTSPSNGSTGKVCTLNAVSGISARVSMGAGINSSQLQVTAQDGSFSETLSSYAETTGTMTFYGVYERAGTYVVTATYPGRTPQVKTLTVTAGECHVNGQSTSFAF